MRRSSSASLLRRFNSWECPSTDRVTLRTRYLAKPLVVELDVREVDVQLDLRVGFDSVERLVRGDRRVGRAAAERLARGDPDVSTLVHRSGAFLDLLGGELAGGGADGCGRQVDP